MKKTTVIAIVALWIGVVALAAFAIYGTFAMLDDCSHEIENIIEAIGDFAEEAWRYVVIVLPVALVTNKLKNMAIKLYNISKEEKES